MASARANAMTRTPPTGTTNLARLDCPTPSTTTWPVLRALASAFVGVDNDTADQAATMMREAGYPTTQTGAAGLAGLIALSREAGAFEKLGLDASARVLIVVTEQAT